MIAQELIKQAGELADAEKPDEAMELAHRVLLDEPDNPGALYVVGCVLLKAARQVQCIQIAKRIVSVCPRDPRGYGLLALAWGELHRYDESIRNAEKALACRRTDKTLADLAYAYTNAGRWDEAGELCLESLKLAAGDPGPTSEESKLNCGVSLGYIRLAQGNWKDGFRLFRNTMRTKWRKEWTYGDTKEWSGEADAVVMVTGEQGLGDEIMAASMVPDAAKLAGKFVLDCDERLGGLFARSFPGVIVTPTRRSRTVHLPLLPTHHKSLFGLGEIVRQADADFPRAPYLVADPELRRMFRALFGDRKLIGLAWSGGLPRTGETVRMAGLNAFLPLIRRGGEYVSLQYKDDAAEVAEFEKQHGIKIHRFPWATQGAGDLDLLAAFVAELDEVVGVHTTALHLSSALGVPTTILTHRGSGWRYAPDTMLWYPPTTIMHKKRTGESWRDCVSRLAQSRK